MDYVVADTHFGHNNIIKHCNRPFKDYIEMDEHMIKAWNETVGPEDRVFHLGDFSMKLNKEKTQHILSRLNGYKILIPGNHDTHHGVSWWKSIGFDEVLENGESLVYEDRYLFSHRPIVDARYFNVHGHIHNTPLPDVMGNMFLCVSVEMTNYRPISITKVDELVKG